ncbi:energy transducer TonB [Sphingomonas kyeonggiensis]|uniref:Protein TonB n=1 Tax=Sphingomonas kyeonggiensis TaxID=1268553 RepID=A0A7W6NXU9_9SPHN|nr:TonB family protein [Sphingomonas kyeonggiensis]MBB4100534.1 protein TonB [Sphingomonas kyeonggiensis]
MRQGAGISSPRERLGSAFCALVLVGLLVLMLAHGLGVRLNVVPTPAMQLVDFALPPPPPPEPEIAPKPRPRTPKEEGKAAPPNLVSRATEVATPVKTPLPQPMPAATTPAQGSDASSGNAPIAGPGTGAGGVGNGTGSGGRGNGAGGGGGTVLRLLEGDITGHDYPRAAARAGAQGTVGLRFTVGVNGRVTDCQVTRSSGNADLDETTCRLIKKRFRYAPSRDASGRPYADVVTGEQEWVLYDRPGRDEDD